jgi:serine/threonine-protein kinase RsbT
MKHLPDVDRFWHQSEPARDEARVEIRIDSDVVVARQKGRELARRAGFTGSDVALIATAISEVARNIVTFAAPGEIAIAVVGNDGAGGISLIARDQGPGIPDVDGALRDGVSTGGGFGIGLPGARRLMDEFHIYSRVGEGTVITMTKRCADPRRPRGHWTPKSSSPSSVVAHD